MSYKTQNYISGKVIQFLTF